MRISDLLAVFDSDVVFVRLNDKPIDVRRYASLDPSRWSDSPNGRWVAIALASHTEGSSTESWSTIFDRLANTPGTPEAVVFVVVDDLETLPVFRLLRYAEAQGMQFVAAFPLRYEVVSGALLAVPTEHPISLHRWLQNNALPAERNANGARLAFSQFILGDAVRRMHSHRLMLAQDRSNDTKGRMTNSLVLEAERNARRRERHLKIAIESLTDEVRVAKMSATADTELLKSIRRSSAYRLGNLIGRSARNPLWAVVGFPVELGRIIRGRRSAAEQAERAQQAVRAAELSASLPNDGPDAQESPIHIRHESFLRFPSSADLLDTPSIAFIAHPAYGGSRRSPWQYDLQPNNAIQLLERQLPHALVIDSSAFLSGSPWYGGATAIDPSRTALLLDVVSVAHQYGVPCVFRWDSPPAAMPMLLRVAATSDLVIANSRETTNEDLPTVDHGIALEAWLGHRASSPSRTLAHFDESDLLSFRTVTYSGFDGLDPTWQTRNVTSSTLHKPAVLRRVLQWSGVVRFPRFKNLHLPILEALAMSVPVIGGRSIHFSDLYEVGDQEWSGDRLMDLQRDAYLRAHEVAWKLRSEFSTASEARSIGELLSIGELTKLAPITVVTAVAEGETSANVELINTTSDLIQSLICVSDQASHQRAAQLVARAESLGVVASLAMNWTEAAAVAAKAAAPSGYIWMVRPDELTEPPGAALKRLLSGGPTLSTGISPLGDLIPVQEVSGVSAEEAGWFMYQLHTKRLEATDRIGDV